MINELITNTYEQVEIVPHDLISAFTSIFLTNQNFTKVAFLKRQNDNSSIKSRTFFQQKLGVTENFNDTKRK